LQAGGQRFDPAQLHHSGVLNTFGVEMSVDQLAVGWQEILLRENKFAAFFREVLPVLNHIVKRRHAGIAPILMQIGKRGFACQVSFAVWTLGFFRWMTWLMLPDRASFRMSREAGLTWILWSMLYERNRSYELNVPVIILFPKPLSLMGLDGTLRGSARPDVVANRLAARLERDQRVKTE
jgi:hypothetical protein